MSNESTILLEINGEDFSGWKDASIVFDMENLSSTFSLSLYDRGGDVTRSLRTGLACRLSVAHPKVPAPTLLVDGFIVSTTRTLNAESNEFTVEGADRLIDIVECSAIYTSQTWTNKRFSSIVADLLEPFSVDLDRTQLRDDPKIEKFTVQSGETAFAAIERLCRSQAVLPLSTFSGTLLLGYAATTSRTVEDLEVGVNVQTLSETKDWTERFSEYTALGQYPGNGRRWSKEILQGKALSFDAGVSRYRPKLFIAESKAEKKALDVRVRWEAQVRSGRATEHVVGLSGWWQRTREGTISRLWAKNELINLRFPSWDLDTDRLITRVELSLGEEGEQTQLTLKHPDTFAPNPFEEVDLS